MPILGLSLEGRVGFATVGARALKLLFVGLILYVLFGLMRGMTVCGDHSVPQVRALMKEFRMGALNFRVEYDRWPRVLDGEVSESPMELSSAALATLLNFPSPEAESDNPKKIIFWDLRQYRNRVGGVLVEAGVPSRFLDPWGSPFWVSIDANEDGRVPNPEAGAPGNMRFDKDASSELPVPVIIFSAGPDKDPGTWKDNITSWRD